MLTGSESRLCGGCWVYNVGTVVVTLAPQVSRQRANLFCPISITSCTYTPGSPRVPGEPGNEAIRV